MDTKETFNKSPILASFIIIAIIMIAMLIMYRTDIYLFRIGRNQEERFLALIAIIIAMVLGGLKTAQYRE